MPSALVRREHGPDGVDGGIEPLGHLAIGDFQRAGARHRRIELGGETRAVGPERVQLGVQRLLAAVGLVSPLDRGRKRIECERKTFAGRVDTGRIRQPCGVKIFCVGKQLQKESYVARGLVVNV